EELPLKDSSLVNTVLITDTRSFGAIKDVGLALFRAVTRGSYAVIYFPPDRENNESEYSRARTLALSHFTHLSKEFPWIKHYVRFADSVEQVGEYSRAIIGAATST